MLRELTSKPYRAAKRAVHATLLRFDLELNRAGTREQLEKAKQMHSTLQNLENQLQRELKKAEQLESQLDSSRPPARGGGGRGAGEAEQLQEESQQPEKQERREKRREERRKRESQRASSSEPKKAKRQRERLREELAEAKRRLREGDWQAANLRKEGLSPKTVVDVGVNKGTPELYKAFPEAYHVLIEPLKENEPYLQRILQEYEGEYFLTAVGARDEVLTINVQAGGDRQKSSLLSRTDEYKLDPALERREVPVTTLDGLLEKHKFEPPFGLKVDTEGFDYQVIEGASNFLRDTQFVIAEVNMAKIYEGSYTFADFIRIMDEHGFYLCDILRKIGKTAPSSELKFIDAMFRKADHARTGAQEP